MTKAAEPPSFGGRGPRARGLVPGPCRVRRDVIFRACMSNNVDQRSNEYGFGLEQNRGVMGWLTEYWV